MKSVAEPKAWGLGVSSMGELMVGNHGVLALARKYGTPLHVVNENRLAKTARAFLKNVSAEYQGRTSVHFALKSNSVPGVVEIIGRAGLSVEVMTPYELKLAVRLGFASDQIIVNGPCKTAAFLRQCIEQRVHLVIVDSLEELKTLATLAEVVGTTVDILLRVNPDYNPRSMNSSTATGSRTGCAFGLDLKGGEVHTALSMLKGLRSIQTLGFHLHIGTGIGDPGDYSRALRCLHVLRQFADANTMKIRILDVGGGFASPTSRELTSAEMLMYQSLRRLPSGVGESWKPEPREFAHRIVGAVTEVFPSSELPELIYEPGRCIVSPNQFLLLTIQHVKERKGVGTWLIADGGLSTVTMPTYYEYHEVLLCNDVHRPRTGRVNIIGPACFAGDIVYKNKLMPRVNAGEVIAVMDSGAYFTALESSFGFPRPAIIGIDGAVCRVIRSRETFEEMIGRDILD